MKTNKSLPNGCIDDNNVAYTTKIEGYTTSMSDMKELYAIVSKRDTAKLIDDPPDNGSMLTYSIHQGRDASHQQTISKYRKRKNIHIRKSYISGE